MKIAEQLSLGNGIYLVSEIAQILQLPKSQVHSWLNKYWDSELKELYDYQYSWEVNDIKAVNFYSLVEFYVMSQFMDAGVPTKNLFTAHKALVERYQTPFPFALKEILEDIRTDGKKIYLNIEEGIITLDGTKQFNLDLIQVFFHKIEFDNGRLAKRYYPLGKDKSIVLDPDRQFGHPVVGETNIYPEVLYRLYKGGETIKFIAFSYEIEESQVQDAIDYCMAA